MKCFYVIVILTTVGAAAFAQTCRLSGKHRDAGSPG